MAVIDEISEDVYRISVYVKDFDIQFNHFLVKDDEPLLYHAGMRRMFPELKEAVSKIIDPEKLKWISWSHFGHNGKKRLLDLIIFALKMCTN